MSIKVLSDHDYQGASRAVGLLDPALAQDAATKAYVDAAIEGLNWKDSVRAASTANINLSAPGASIDGVTMASLDRFLAKDEGAPATNGIYIWNGAAVAATRALDMNVAAEVEGAITTVEEGTVNASTTWRQSAVNVTLGTTALAWTSFGVVAPAASETVAGIAEIATQAETDAGTDDARIVTPLKLKTSPLSAHRFAADIGDGVSTSIAVTHSFSSRDVQVQVYRSTTPWDTIFCDVTRNSANQVTLGFAAAPTTNQYRVLVQY